jgi:uncharacterized protein (TIGR02421 family)
MTSSSEFPSGTAPASPPAQPDPAVTGAPWRSYKERVARLAERLVQAQQPIKILDAVKWRPEVFERCRTSRWRDPPEVGPDAYQRTPIGFDPEEKRSALRELDADIERELGRGDSIGLILQDTTRQYLRVVELLEARGTHRFYEISRELYGSAKQPFVDGARPLRDIALDLYEILSQLDGSLLGAPELKDHSAERAVILLNERLAGVFGDRSVRVVLDDGIVADAAAGGDVIKIRRGATFSARDIRVLEVHEGWVHVATSLNGQRQPVARWLAKGPPRTTAAQEGLAALVELLTYSSHPARARRINDRVLAIDKAEDGADFLEVFEWFRTEGYDEETCFVSTMRVFRGGVVSGGAPFTKDVVYTRGIVEVYGFLMAAIARGRPELARWVFAGKVALEDVPVLAARAHEGLVKPPSFVPDMFRDLNGLAIWLGVSTFWGHLPSVQRHFERLLDAHA